MHLNWNHTKTQTKSKRKMVNKAWRIIPRPLLETVLNNHAQHHRVPQPLILHGPRGVGKTTLILERNLKNPLSLCIFFIFVRFLALIFSFFRSTRWVEQRSSPHWLYRLCWIHRRPPSTIQQVISMGLMVELSTTRFVKLPKQARTHPWINGWKGCQAWHH